VPRVTFVSERRWIDVAEGTTVLEAARRAGVAVDSPCAGDGTCGKCAVRLAPGSRRNVTARARHRLEKDGYLLSCAAAVTGPLEVETLAPLDAAGLAIQAEGVSAPVSVAPFVRRVYRAEEDVTDVLGGEQLLARLAGEQLEPACGAVVDLGTTTIVAALVDLATGRELGFRSALNPQATYAHDVMSRVKLGSTAEGLALLQREVCGAMRGLLRELCDAAGVPASSIHEVVLSGNTCMLHLAVGESPRGLGRHPYTPHLAGGNHVPAASLRLGVADGALVYLPPVASAFVGADIASGLLATGLATRAGTTLFLDVGTNGEMVLARDGRLLATSTAAGPAFEGMTIACGMRAADGAIDAVRIAEDGACEVSVLGGGRATGLCGTGLIDAAAELVRVGVVQPSGRFARAETVASPRLRERLGAVDGKPAFFLAEGVYLSQGDLRQLQLAKAATRVGVDFLLRAAGVDVGALGRVLVAGGFGYHLRPESVVGIGLLPREALGRIEFVGNTSKSGARAFLLDAGRREELRAVVQRMEVVELTRAGDFDRRFVERIAFAA
jgi:uncharacterized 2Fe-2S/4Fe-4S cluster protein (DUF4445 family)